MKIIENYESKRYEDTNLVLKDYEIKKLEKIDFIPNHKVLELNQKLNDFENKNKESIDSYHSFFSCFRIFQRYNEKYFISWNKKIDERSPLHFVNDDNEYKYMLKIDNYNKSNHSKDLLFFNDFNEIENLFSIYFERVKTMYETMKKYKIYTLNESFLLKIYDNDQKFQEKFKNLKYENMKFRRNLKSKDIDFLFKTSIFEKQGKLSHNLKIDIKTLKKVIYNDKVEIVFEKMFDYSLYFKSKTSYDGLIKNMKKINCKFKINNDEFKIINYNKYLIIEHNGKKTNKIKKDNYYIKKLLDFTNSHKYTPKIVFDFLTIKKINLEKLYTKYNLYHPDFNIKGDLNLTMKDNCIGTIKLTSKLIFDFPIFNRTDVFQKYEKAILNGNVLRLHVNDIYDYIEDKEELFKYLRKLKLLS